MEKKYCSTCGSSLNKSEKFCMNCGNSLQKTRTEKVPSRSKWKLPMIVMAGIVIGIASIAMVNKAPLIQSLLNFKDDNEMYVEPDVDDVIVYRSYDQAGLMDLDLEIIRENISQYITEFNEFGIAVAQDYESNSGEEWLINKEGIQIGAKYPKVGMTMTMDFDWNAALSEGGVVNFLVDNYGSDGSMMGLMNMDGEIVLEPRPIQISGFKGLKVAEFKENNVSGVISELGEIIIAPMYDQLSILTNEYFLAKRSNDQQNYSIINVNGDIIKENFTSEQLVSWGEDLFIFRSGNGKYGVINDELEEIIPPTFIGYVSPSYTNDFIISEGVGEYYVFNRKGERILADIAVDYLSSPDLYNRFPFIRGTEFGLMDERGEVIFSQEAPYYSSGNQFDVIFGLNVYKFMDSNGDERFYNVNGNFISEEGGYNTQGVLHFGPGSRSQLMTIIRGGSGGSTIIGTNGNPLADEPTYIHEVGDYLYYHDESDWAYLVNKFTGEVIKEKNLYPREING